LDHGSMGELGGQKDRLLKGTEETNMETTLKPFDRIRGVGGPSGALIEKGVGGGRNPGTATNQSLHRKPEHHWKIRRRKRPQERREGKGERQLEE